MNLAVKLYGDMSNKPTDIPNEWPYEVIELGNSQELPQGSYTLMTTEEYSAYRAAHLADYLVYAAANGIS